MAISSKLLIFVFLAATIIYVYAQSHQHNSARNNPNRRKHPNHNYGEEGVMDSVPSATNHGGWGGRVQIKVYRGASKGWGWDTFAPYGYWVKQPPDNHGWGH